MKNIQTKDLEVLANLFFPLHDHLLIIEKNKEKTDPGNLPPGQIVLAQPKSGLPDEALFRQAAGMIVLGETEPPAGFESRLFEVVKNPDGSIRWLFPSEGSSPVFLKLYNGSGWRGWLFRTVFRAAFLLGLKRWLSAGRVSVFFRKRQLLDEVLAIIPHDDFAIFTGTAGENRKAVMALCGKEMQGWFFKLPLTASARQLVEQEQAALQELQELSLRKIHAPSFVPINEGVLLSNIRPAAFSNSTVLMTLHLEALGELHSQTLQHLPLCSLPAWNEIRLSLDDLNTAPTANELCAETVAQLTERLYRLYETFNPYILAPTAMAHGDFTPWNMYLAKEKLHLYDWELSERLPVLYDAFHFIFQSGILIKRLPFSKIQEEIKTLKSSSLATDFLAGQPVDFNWLYRFYLLRNTSYYLQKYVRQPHLHDQAYWLVNTWIQALEGEMVRTS